MISQPLISVIVLTYNSAQYVTATLESIRNQSYSGEIELIIGDDCSTDNTIDICERWLDSNRDKFSRCKIIIPEENQGVVANINSCFRESRGAWVKAIAGDDILIEHALETLYHAAKKHNVSFVYSAVHTFTDDADITDPKRLPLLAGGPGDQLVDLNYTYHKPNFWLNAPTFFISTDLLRTIGFVPVLFRNIEDRPLFAKVLASGYKIWHCSTPTVLYRTHAASISSTIEPGKFAECNWKTYQQILRPCYNVFRAIDIDLRMLPSALLAKTRRKTVSYRLLRLFSQLAWLLWRCCTFGITR